MTEIIEATETKWCPRCLEWKHFSDFYRNKASKDNCQAYCKECFNKFLNEPKRAVRRAEFSKEYNTRPDVVKERRKRQKEYNQQEQVKRRAASNSAVVRAVKNGTLPHISQCICQTTSCNNQAQEYHHWAGYDKKNWLDVLPLCIECHRKLP